MVARTALEALTLPPLRLLRSPWPWRSLAYLGSGVLLGLASVLALITLGTLGVVLLIGVVGLLALPGMVWVGIVVARFERRRLRLVDTEPAYDPHRRPGRPGWRAWLSTRTREAATWREFGYLLVSALALWWIDLLLVSAVLYVPLMFMSAPFVDSDLPIYLTVPSLLGGIGILPLATYPIMAWAGTRAAIARAVLSPRDTELTARLVEVSRSRARLVDAFELERRRIERDLHDGAQQRLVALSMTLGLARLDLPVDSPAGQQVARAHEQAKEALAELRELIRGVHPQVLSDRGLPAAVEDVAGRSPLPVDVDLPLPGRLPAAAEQAAYFVVTEALANVAKHSGATRARVGGGVTGVAGDWLVVEVRDDGVGGADPAAGSGLTGLADRVAAVDGRLLLSSPAGGPTVVRAEIPCG
ncbi:sensor histidine kinase [Polymorphospora rubra]|uniref:histidine kinase n=1 Tax=Polymorphospora rubra TaxID=338584 RepID=A0A810N7X7_9ACTN|nr:sensor histidine kinase [Polymorphospora rubra]BCJ67505.1 histidine kinase [Polymorphospora rubra]